MMTEEQTDSIDSVFETQGTSSGFVAIIGRPNVGKSTLLNSIIGSKLSITTKKPQTTRYNILGIKTKENLQSIYIDTPGMHKFNEKKINRYMNKAAKESLVDVDVVVFVVEACIWQEEDIAALKNIENIDPPKILVINKVDKFSAKENLLPFIEKMASVADFNRIIPLSALDPKQVTSLEEKVMQLLPEGPFYYPEKDITDKPIKFRMAEIIREKLMQELEQELPYAIAVSIEDISVGTKQNIHAAIWVERASQKSIVIGKQGSCLKRIGIKSRFELEKLLDQKVNLKLWVKVKRQWTDNNSALHEMGLMEV